MLKRWRLRINNRFVAAAGVLGVGLLPCPDCGLPLAAHIWPVAAVAWLWRRWRRRGEQQLDLLLTRDLAGRVPPEEGKDD
jgi:hypothetical protein